MPVIAAIDVERIQSALMSLGQRAGRFHAALAAATGVEIDNPGYRVLKAVSLSAMVRVGDLAHECAVEVPTMSRHIANLVTAGYLDRLPDERDGRVVWVRLSTTGTVLVAAIEAERRRVLSDIFSGWSRTDRDDFVEKLERFAYDLTAFTNESETRRS